MKKTLLKALSWSIGSLLVTSIAWAAYGWKIDNYGNIKAARSSVLLQAGETSNCKLQYSGSTLSIVGSDGNALSTSNPCLVGMPNGAAPLEFTAPVSSTFGAASDTDGNLFGISEANWANSMPWFLHACQGNTHNYLAFSRNPSRISSGAAAADMCQEGDTNCDGQGDMFIMSSGLTLADEVNKTCVTVGSFRTTYATAGNAWTVTALTSQDGFGMFQETITFTFPLGQNGAESVSTCIPNSGTPPTWSSVSGHNYTLSRDGIVNYRIYHNDDAGADGSGAVAAKFALPYSVYDHVSSIISFGSVGYAGNSYSYLGWPSSSGEAFITFYLQDSLSILTWSDFSNGARRVDARITFKAF